MQKRGNGVRRDQRIKQHFTAAIPWLSQWLSMARSLALRRGLGKLVTILQLTPIKYHLGVVDRKTWLAQVMGCILSTETSSTMRSEGINPVADNILKSYDSGGGTQHLIYTKLASDRWSRSRTISSRRNKIPPPDCPSTNDMFFSVQHPQRS